MYCKKCGTQLPDRAAFCFSCGKPTGDGPQNDAVTADSKASKKAVIIAVVLFIILFVGLIVRRSQTRRFDLPASSSLLSTLVTVPHKQKLFSGSIAVNAHSMYWVNFTVDPRMKDVHVSGHFQAYGGRENDIQTVICSAEDFINFKNGHQAQVFFNSGKTTMGDINAQIPATSGTYVLAFNNSFSPLSGKTVNGEVTLNYDTP
ncbi:MAG TPA: zinc-ribbon domain-containing protein [Bryobacteraceae bacterium]|jgi:hypothetical protein